MSKEITVTVGWREVLGAVLVVALVAQGIHIAVTGELSMVQRVVFVPCGSLALALGAWSACREARDDR